MALCLIAFAQLAFAEGYRELVALLAWAAASAAGAAGAATREADLVAQVRQAQGAVSRLSQREAVAAFRGPRRTGTRVP